MMTRHHVVQKITTKKVVSAIPHCILAILITTHAHAQNSPAVAFSLSGLAPYQKLRKEYYLAALFLPSPGSDTVNFAGKKRMEMRVSIDKWTPQRFSNDWSQAIFLNNDQELVKQFAYQIQTFVDLPKDDLIAGDHIAVDMDPDQGTTVSLNGSKVFNVTDNAFFDVRIRALGGSKVCKKLYLTPLNSETIVCDGPIGVKLRRGIYD